MSLKTYYYIYVYLDIRKIGNYSYGDYNFEAEPFYVGKGKNDRYVSHLKYCFKYDNYFYRKLRKIKRETKKDPIIIKVKENISEKDAFIFEKDLIRKIGRKGIGPLTNFTDGGDGISGFKHSQKTKLKIRESHIGLKHTNETKRKMKLSAKNKPSISDETRKKISDSKKGKKLSEETKEKIRMQKGWKHSEESRKKMSNSQKGRKHSKETKIKIRESSQNNWKIISYREKIIKANIGKKRSAETKNKMSRAQQMRRQKERILEAA